MSRRSRAERGPRADEAEQSRRAVGLGGWSPWACRVVSLAIVVHLTALLAGVFAVAPSSPLERALAGWFAPYHELFDMGYSYRFYTEPPPTPVAVATLRFGDGRPDETLRLPARVVPGPRLRYQRQLALAHALYVDAREAKEQTGSIAQSRLARSYARRLCRLHPGCVQVTWHVTQHLIPDREQVREALDSPGGGRFSLFDDSLFSTPEWIGDFPCDGS